MKKYTKDKEEHIHIRISADEKEKLQYYSKFKGFVTVSDYIRYLIRMDEKNLLK